MFSQKISIIYVWEGSDYASLAASFSRVVNKTTYKDTKFRTFHRKTPVSESILQWGLQLYHKQTFQHSWFPVKSTLFYRSYMVAAFREKEQ